MLSFSAATRNRGPILDVLRKYFNEDLHYKMLEIASGSGEHIVYFAQHFPNIIFQPSEINPRYLHSIVAYIDTYKLPNLRVPLNIDVTKAPDFWPLPADFSPGSLDAVYNANMIHISSHSATNGLFRAAGGLLKPKTGRLFLYGPFSFRGVISPQSNVDFHKSLLTQNLEWGLRDLTDLENIACHNGLQLEDVHEMQANNHILLERHEEQSNKSDQSQYVRH